jgi:hypothetical protein
MQLMHGVSAKLRRSLNLNKPNGDTEMRPAQSGIEILVLTNVRSTSRSQLWLNTSPALVIGSNRSSMRGREQIFTRELLAPIIVIIGGNRRAYTHYGVSNLMSAFWG